MPVLSWPLSGGRRGLLPEFADESQLRERSTPPKTLSSDRWFRGTYQDLKGTELTRIASRFAQSPGLFCDLIPHRARRASVLRANPSPEVTDQTCRLPLPTLFYRLEAMNLGDLLRIWVRARVVLRVALSRIFKVRREGPDDAGSASLFAIQTLSRYESIPGVTIAHTEKKTLPGPPDGVSEFFWVTPTSFRS